MAIKKQTFVQSRSTFITVTLIGILIFAIFRWVNYRFETPAQKENEILKTEQNTLNNKIETAKITIDKKDDIITDLKRQLKDLPVENANLRAANERLTQQNENHKEEIKKQLTKGFTAVGDRLIKPFIRTLAIALAAITILISMFTPFDSSLSFFDKIWHFIRRSIPMIIIEILFILEIILIIDGMGAYEGTVIFGVWINTFLIAAIGFILFKIFKFVYGQMNHKIKVIEHTQKRQYTKQIGQSKKTLLLANKNKKRPKKKQEEEVYEEDEDDEQEEYDDDEYDDDDY